MECICGLVHNSASQIVACFEEWEAEEGHAQAEAERLAEEAAERWWEERGGNWRNQIEEDMEHSPFDPIWAM